MRSVALIILASWCLSACSASQAEHENLERRVAALERRLRVVEGGGSSGAKGVDGARRAKSKRTRGKKADKPLGRAKMQPQAAREKGTVMVEGDALRVFLRTDSRRIPVPGNAGVGEYSIRALFDLGAQPVVAGNATVKANHLTTVTCDKATKTCQAAAPTPN